MGTSTSLAAAGAKVGKLLDPSTLTAMAKAGGMAAKKEALDAASASLGGDRKMSGYKRGKALTAGFDVSGAHVTVNYRGAWKLAEEGRKTSKTVRRSGVIFRTPAGPRRSFRSGRSRGLKTLTKAQQGAAREVPKAAHKQLQQEIARTF